ncbi:MAG: hypothetical protein WHV44_05795 [Anaerolineales bacterium]
MSILKPIRWKTFPRDFLRIQTGFAIFGFAIALMVRANLGTSAWAVLEVALARLTGLSIGVMSIIVGLAVLVGALILQEKIGWGTLGNILFIGPWIDLTLWLIPPVENNPALQTGMLLSAIFLMGLASALYIGVDAGAGPRDSLMLAIRRTTGLSLRMARGSLEITVVLLGWLLGGPAGIGTLIFAVLIGPSVQWWFKHLNVEHHAPAQPNPAATD